MCEPRGVLAGPGEKIAMFMTLTVVRPDDLADRLLDRDKHPQWQGERTKMVFAFPGDEALWAKYAEMRADGLRAERGLVAACRFRNLFQLLTVGGVVRDPVCLLAWADVDRLDSSTSSSRRRSAVSSVEYVGRVCPDVPRSGHSGTTADLGRLSKGGPWGLAAARGPIVQGCGGRACVPCTIREQHLTSGLSRRARQVLIRATGSSIGRTDRLYPIVSRRHRQEQLHSELCSLPCRAWSPSRRD